MGADYWRSLFRPLLVDGYKMCPRGLPYTPAAPVEKAFLQKTKWVPAFQIFLLSKEMNDLKSARLITVSKHTCAAGRSAGSGSIWEVAAVGAEHVVPWPSHPVSERVYTSHGPEGICCLDSPYVRSDGVFNPY